MEALQIPLQGSVGVAHVAQLHTTAFEGIEAGSSIVFDLSEARDIDASIVQLMLATQALTDSRDLETKVIGISEMLSDSLTKFGAEELLELVCAETQPEAPTETPHAPETPPAPETQDSAAALAGESSENPADANVPASEPVADTGPETISTEATDAPRDGALVAAANAFFGTDEQTATPAAEAASAETDSASVETDEPASNFTPESTDNESTDLVHDSTTTSEGMDE